MILVCGATRTELAACARGIAASGSLGFETLLVGVGRQAGAALRARLATGPVPSLVVSTGFAGALNDDLAVGQWLTASALAEWSEDAGVLVPRADLPVVRAPAPARACVVVSSATLAAADGPLARHARTAPPLGVDMESIALAEAAPPVPLMVLRLVSDSPVQPLPSFLAPFTAALTGSSLRARLGHAARGVRGAAADPRGVARLLKEGPEWTRQLTAGWTLFASALSERETLEAE